MLDEAERTLVNLLRGEAGRVGGDKYSFVRATAGARGGGRYTTAAQSRARTATRGAKRAAALRTIWSTRSCTRLCRV